MSAVDMMVEPGRGDVRVEFRGSIDLACIDELKQVLRQAMDVAGNLLIDLKEVDFIGSCGIAVLLNTAACLKEQDRSLRLVGCSRSVARVFRLLRLEYLLP